MTDWSAVIPDLAEREEAVRLYVAMVSANEAASASTPDESDASDDQRAQITAIEDEYDRKQQELEAWFDGARKRVLASGNADLALLNDYALVARQKYADPPTPALALDDDENPVRCAKSGAPIYEDDEFVEDGETGEIWLRAALGLPSRSMREVQDAA